MLSPELSVLRNAVYHLPESTDDCKQAIDFYHCVHNRCYIFVNGCGVLKIKVPVT